MIRIQGKPLSPEIKKFIVSIKQYFDRNKADFGQTALSSQKMTADALGIGLATVNRVMADYNKDPGLLYKVPQPKGRPSYSVNESHEAAVRNFIREANHQGKYITLDIIRDFLKKRDPDQSFSIVTLSRTLDRWGFTFGKGTRTQHLKEKDYVIAARRRYLRKKISNRLGEKGKTLRPEVYLDESYVNKNHSNDLIWYYGEDGPWVQKPAGKGERLIMMNAITIEGWVPGAKLVFKATKKTGDYHGQMNWELFRKWVTEMLIPNIPDNSLIIMDNAPYHNTLSVNSAPLPTCSKAKIQAWLEANKIPCREDSLKSELVEILKKLAPEPIFAIDEIVKEFGHEVIRTPPYHPELQPIENCWGVVKNHVGRACNFTMSNLIGQLDQGFNKVTAYTCSEIIKETNRIEDKFWKEDLEADENE